MRKPKTPPPALHTMSFIFPWPSPVLSPNARPHWGAVARAKKAARTLCRGIALGSYAQGHKNIMAALNLPKESISVVDVSLIFCASTARRYDADNALAGCKASLDGLADALGIDDSSWQVAAAHGPVERLPRGRGAGVVRVTVTLFGHGEGA